MNILENRHANLIKLAQYLYNLQPTFERQFDMENFAINRDDQTAAGFPNPHEVRESECGTVCCALGHGPLAGITPIYGESWMSYLNNFISKHDRESFDYLFSGSWAPWDNTPQGAALRILSYVDAPKQVLAAFHDHWGVPRFAAAKAYYTNPALVHYHTKKYFTNAVA